ncbi:MAG: carboxypeptidase-like regulatory domain-containing protein [Thermoanaerobaculia bacterium]|nr:carboxypeptidase-like regulatory domain-containing protein [Thermoanaerobaculia bacterium]
MKHCTPWLVMLALWAGGWLVPPVSAQPAVASLGGRVVDEQGEGVSGAKVFARREGTKVRRSTEADVEGYFLFPALPPGNWDVEASAPGFTVRVVADVRLVVVQNRHLDLTLEPSDVQEMVSVVDYPPLVRTTPGLGVSLDRRELTNLPLRFRNLSELQGHSLLTIVTSPVDVRLDGGLVSPSSQPPWSSILEADLAEHSSKVAHGRSAGVVSLLTRSGGSTRRGEAFVLHRDERLDAAVARRHLGVSLGGPYGRQRSGKGSHFFVAAEVEDGDDPGRRGFLGRGSRHDRRNLALLRLLRDDPEGRGRLDSLLVAWQTRLTSNILHDLTVQVEDLESSDGSLHDRRNQLRSDVFATAASGIGVHDLAFGVESVETSFDDSSTDRWSLFARDRWQVADRLSLLGGLRLDTFEDARRDEERWAPRLGLVWDLDGAGNHLLRGGAGRFGDPEAGDEIDRFSLGWSWQINPFLGLTVDAMTVDSAGRSRDYEAFAVTIRSRFSDVFQVRASYSRTEPDAVGVETQDRTVVTGLYKAPADILVAAVYRSDPSPVLTGFSVLHRPREDPFDAMGLDLRVAKIVPVGGDVSLEVLAEVFDLFEEQEDERGRMGQLGVRLSF